MRKDKTFGQYLRELRTGRKITLRKFCEALSVDPKNISKMERDLLPAPQADATLRHIARVLGLGEGSDKWMKFFDLASVSNKTLGSCRIKGEAVLQKLPILFHPLENKELTEEELDCLIEMIRSS